MKRLSLMLLFGFISTPVFAQQEESTTENIDTTWKDTEQTIEVQQKVADQAIENRFESILQISQRVNEAEVEVKEGVLILRGWTHDETNRDWVENAANRTEGVIAVVNNIELRVGEQWDLQPAVNEALSLYDKFVRAIPKMVIALVIILLTWVVAKTVTTVATKALSSRIHTPFVLRMSARLFSLPVVVIGVYLVLQLTGLTHLAMTVIGGTGLLGLVIGIAFKDIAENFLASILISIQRPFKIGDYICVSDYQGVVQSVTTRGTVIMTLDGNHIHIPNATIYKNTITNVTANPNIRKQFTVGIGYEDSISEAQQIALEVLRKHQAVLDDPEAQVLVNNLGAATVNLKVSFWVDGSVNSASKVKSAVIRLIKRAFDDAAISMPDEAREVVFPQGIQVTQVQPTESVKPVKTTKPEEPELNAIEQDLSNDVDEIRKQAEENQLSDQDDNLIKE
jgi:small conductance mechanosensitive channel